MRGASLATSRSVAALLSRYIERPDRILASKPTKWRSVPSAHRERGETEPHRPGGKRDKLRLEEAKRARAERFGLAQEAEKVITALLPPPSSPPTNPLPDWPCCNGQPCRARPRHWLPVPRGAQAARL
jgi:hypothetical protein